MHALPKLSFFLLVGVVLAQDNVCPVRIYPCACSDVDRTNGIQVRCEANDKSFEDLQYALDRMTGKKIYKLKVSGYNMDNAPSDFFNGLSLRQVNLKGIRIREMPAFRGSEHTLEMIHLNDKAISESTIETFTLKVNHLPRLKSFYFNYNSYTQDTTVKTITVGDNWFENGPSSLETVYINGNQAESFGDRVFSKLGNLKEIELNANRINKLNRTMFPNPAGRLLTIQLSDNLLDSLPEDIFSNMPVLARVDISSNPITVLDELTWRPVWEKLDSLMLNFPDSNSSLTCGKSIAWLFNVKRPRYLYAYCDKTDATEAEYKGKRLSEIIDEKQYSPSKKIKI